MKKFRQILLAASVFIFLAAGCNKGAETKSAQNNNQPVSQSINEQVNSTANKSASSSAGNEPISKAAPAQPVIAPSLPTSQNENATDTQALKTISVQQTVYEGKQAVGGTDIVPQGMDELTLLKRTKIVETKDYPGIGEFVTSIDTISGDSGHFWEFFVNGKSSNIGAGSYILKDGDNIEWKLSEIK